MASSTSTLEPQSGWLQLPAIAKLAGWRFRQMWRFLFVTWLGLLAMVVIACTPPLFSHVAISANLRSLGADTPNGQNIIVAIASLYPTNSQVQQIAREVNNELKQGSFLPYLQQAPRLIVQSPPLLVQTSPGQRQGLSLVGYEAAAMAHHTTVIQGHLPQDTNMGEPIEIALTQDLARSLGVQPDDLLQGSYDAVGGTQHWPLKVVGIVAAQSAHDPFWLTQANPFGALYGDPGEGYNVLAPAATVQARVANLQSAPNTTATHLLWSYPFNTTSLDASVVPALSQQAKDLQFGINSVLPHIQGVTFAGLFGAFIDDLAGYVQQIVLLEIVVTFLLLLILAIVLFLVGMLSGMLVERQEGIIATLRSRGATRRHVFGSFVAQGVVLGLFALLAGPLLAVQLVRLLGQVLLSPANQSALNVVTSDPVQGALEVKWFALAAVVLGVVIMVAAIGRSAKLDIVGLRRESSRVRSIPFWRRLHLDLLLILLIVGGYLLYTFLWSIFSSSLTLDPVLYSVLKIGGFIAPPLLVAALLLLFLRCFPLISRLSTRLLARRRSAPAVLALSQVERSPRPAARIIGLMALTIASCCFLFTLMATRYDRTGVDAAFAVGADFGGPLSAADSLKTYDALQTQYSQFPGVQAATIGFSDTVQTSRQEIELVAADTSKLASILYWPQGNAAQSLSDLAAQLLAHRTNATSGTHTVYALVNAVLWQRYQLSPGAAFTLPVSDTSNAQINFVALAKVNYIPGYYDTPLDGNSNVGLIVDYQSYASAYQNALKTDFAPNHVWLRTSDDPSALSRIRQAYPQLQDRRAVTSNNQEDTVHIDLVGVLAIGIGAALILALLGTLLSSWLNATSRLTSFAVMRALGMNPRQLAALLLWEHGYIFLLAFLLGLGLGALLTIFAAPAVSLLDLSGPSSLYNPYDIPPVQLSIPWQPLLLLLAGLVLICLVALLLMARIVSRPSISQTLRLNED